MQCLFDVDGQLIALAAGQGAAMSAHHGAHVFERRQVRADRHRRNAEPLSQRCHRSLRLLLDERADVSAALFHREPAGTYGMGQDDSDARHGCSSLCCFQRFHFRFEFESEGSFTCLQSLNETI